VILSETKNQIHSKGCEWKIRERSRESKKAYNIEKKHENKESTKQRLGVQNNKQRRNEIQEKEKKST
jgi:hypothetical protein